MPEVGEYWYVSYSGGHMIVYITYINEEEDIIHVKVLRDTDSIHNWTNSFMPLGLGANLKHFSKKLTQSELTLELLE